MAEGRWAQHRRRQVRSLLPQPVLPLSLCMIWAPELCCALAPVWLTSLESCSPSNLACAVAAGGKLPAASSETEQLLTLLQELEEEVFAATASAEKEEVRRAHAVE